LLAEEELGAGNAGFAMLVAVFGLGVIAGSLAGARTTQPSLLKRRYLIGMGFSGLGFLIAAAAPGVVLAAFGFAVAGVGNGLSLVHERLLVQVTVSDRLLGRTFGLRDTLDAWAWTIAFASAGLLFAALGTRAVLALAGGGVLVVAAASTWILRNAWAETDAVPAEALPQLVERLDVEEPVPAQT
jgi:MFS family permease